MALPPIEGVSSSARVAGLTQQDRTEKEPSRKTSGSEPTTDTVELSAAALKKLEDDRSAEENSARRTAVEVRDTLANNTDISL